MNCPTSEAPAGAPDRGEPRPVDERSPLERALQLRAFDGRLTVAQRAALIAVFLELARGLDTRDAQSKGGPSDLCAWDAQVVQAADHCRAVAVMLGQATAELAAVRNTVRRCLTALSMCDDACRPHRDADVFCARRVEIAKRGERACVDLLSFI